MRRTYEQALHAMQTGVAFIMGREPQETEAKHLRVGVNSAMCDNAALARLLIQKGVISEQEYLAAIAKEMNNEADRYEARVQSYLGDNAHVH
jgi:hypothetical protein